MNAVGSVGLSTYTSHIRGRNSFEPGTGCGGVKNKPEYEADLTCGRFFHRENVFIPREFAIETPNINSLSLSHLQGAALNLFENIFTVPRNNFSKYSYLCMDTKFIVSFTTRVVVRK